MSDLGEQVERVFGDLSRAGVPFVVGEVGPFNNGKAVQVDTRLTLS